MSHSLLHGILCLLLRSAPPSRTKIAARIHRSIPPPLSRHPMWPVPSRKGCRAHDTLKGSPENDSQRRPKCLHQGKSSVITLNRRSFTREIPDPNAPRRGSGIFIDVSRIAKPYESIAVRRAYGSKSHQRNGRRRDPSILYLRPDNTDEFGRETVPHKSHTFGKTIPKDNPILTCHRTRCRHLTVDLSHTFPAERPKWPNTIRTIALTRPQSRATAP